MEPLVATASVTARSLNRVTGDIISMVERDGAVVAISRNGRFVAVIIPVPDVIALETPEPPDGVARPPSSPRAWDVDVEPLELTPLESQFIIDAASTPTGFWRSPASAGIADHAARSEAVFELVIKGLLDARGGGSYRISEKGRAAARALRARGQQGYAEVHGDGYLDP